MPLDQRLPSINNGPYWNDTANSVQIHENNLSLILTTCWPNFEQADTPLSLPETSTPQLVTTLMALTCSSINTHSSILFIISMVNIPAQHMPQAIWVTHSKCVRVYESLGEWDSCQFGSLRSLVVWTKLSVCQAFFNRVMFTLLRYSLIWNVVYPSLFFARHPVLYSVQHELQATWKWD